MAALANFTPEYSPDRNWIRYIFGCKTWIRPQRWTYDRPSTGDGAAHRSCQKFYRIICSFFGMVFGRCSRCWHGNFCHNDWTIDSFLSANFYPFFYQNWIDNVYVEFDLGAVSVFTKPQSFSFGCFASSIITSFKSGYNWVPNRRSFPVARTTRFKAAIIAGAK